MTTRSIPDLDLSSAVHQARGRLIEGIREHQRGKITLTTLYRLADEYRHEIREHGRRTGRTLPIPSRAYILRALA